MRYGRLIEGRQDTRLAQHGPLAAGRWHLRRAPQYHVADAAIDRQDNIAGAAGHPLHIERFRAEMRHMLVEPGREALPVCQLLEIGPAHRAYLCGSNGRNWESEDCHSMSTVRWAKRHPAPVRT